MSLNLTRREKMRARAEVVGMTFDQLADCMWEHKQAGNRRWSFIVALAWKDANPVEARRIAEETLKEILG